MNEESKSTMMNEKVSVAICTYCGERYIADQLNSILRQTRPVQEIVLCDDRSADRTAALAEEVLRESGIPFRILINEENLGVTGNFEKSISLCTGELILTADQDDVWAPDKVERLLKAFSEPRVVLAYSDAGIVDADGGELLPSLYRRDGFWPEPFTQKTVEDAIIRLSQTVYGCTMAFRRDFVSQIIPFFNSRANHDAWILCCAPLFGEIRFCPEPLISYRIHGGNTVASVRGSSAWDGIRAAQDAYDAHFAIQPLRALRLRLLREALDRCAGGFGGRRYRRNVSRAERMYKRLLDAKTCGRFTGAMMLTASLLDGSYRYRFCDRGRPVGPLHRIKQYVWDVMYMLHR